MAVKEKADIPVLRTVAELRALRRSFAPEASVGFVPTMGYLHEGHMTLIGRSLEKNDHTIISIFVNPSQFAPTEDLDTYPRDLDHDMQVITDYLREHEHELGSGKKVDAIFKPTVEEMYPSGFTMDISQQRGAFVEVLGVSNPLEGKKRPSFFRGVATVVTKLFNAVNPTTAYFGQKDIQQTVVVKTMVRDLLMDLHVEVVPTVRNEHGLALSSRNKYLSSEMLSQVTCLYRSMKLSLDAYTKNSTTSVDALTQIVTETITSTNSQFRIDYVSFNDPETLDYITEVDPKKGCILSMAVYVPNSLNVGESQETRLIDNMIFPALS